MPQASGSSSLSPQLFDRAYADLADDDGGVAALFGAVMGDEYPTELAPNSLVTWSVLREVAANGWAIRDDRLDVLPRERR